MVGTGTKIIAARTVENLFCEVVLVCIEKQKSKNQDVCGVFPKNTLDNL